MHGGLRKNTRLSSHAVAKIPREPTPTGKNQLLHSAADRAYAPRCTTTAASHAHQKKSAAGGEFINLSLRTTPATHPGLHNHTLDPFVPQPQPRRCTLRRDAFPSQSSLLFTRRPPYRAHLRPPPPWRGTANADGVRTCISPPPPSSSTT